MEQNQHEIIFEDLARGCFLGALAGDALGSYLEFRKEVTEEDVQIALALPGGGPFKLGRGQITDDGELSLCLGQGLIEGKGSLDLGKIAEKYADWMKSMPFD